MKKFTLSNLIFLMVVGFVLGGFLGGRLQYLVFRWDAIQEGHAEYNQTTGDFQWKEPCR